MTNVVFPSTGMKKKARRVFGDAVDDAECNSSLAYSPSPQSKEAKCFSPVLESRNSSDSSGNEKENTVTSNKKTSDSISSSHSTESSKSMQERLRTMRTAMSSARSPLSRDLVKKTQDAIKKATTSVNQSLLAAKLSKQTDLHQKMLRTSSVRSHWQSQTHEVKEFNRMEEQSRRLMISLQQQVSSQYSRNRANKARTERQLQLQTIEEESQFKSTVFRDHQQSLHKLEEERRRKSIAARAKLRANQKLGQEKLKQQQIQEEQAILEERYEYINASRNFKAQSAQQRRKSFAFRNGDARRIRQLQAQMEADRLKKEHESLELKRQAEKDAENYQKKLAEERRLSLEQRNRYAHQLRQQAELEKANALQKEHESFELKREACKDVEKYILSLEEERRQSLALRNREAKKYRDLMAQQQAEESKNAKESFELKWAGERDAEKYVRQMEEAHRISLAARNLEARMQREAAELDRCSSLEEEHKSYELKRAAAKDAEEYLRKEEHLRRESLEKRNKERVQHAKLMEELRSLALEQEAESYVLKWAGETDAKKYLEKLAEERRKSLQKRGEQIVHNREIDNEQKQKQILQSHKDEELRSGDQKDVEEYRRACAERNRKSLQYRGKELHVQRVQLEEKKLKQNTLDEMNYALETAARKDVEEYINQCKQRRRMSLALRAKEKRQSALWRRQQYEKELQDQSERIHNSLMDHRHAELARQQERARLAIDALRLAGKSTHPFSGIVE
jgi:hypothetical protein